MIYIFTLEHVYSDETQTDSKLLGFFYNMKSLENTRELAAKRSGF